MLLHNARKRQLTGTRKVDSRAPFVYIRYNSYEKPGAYKEATHYAIIAG